MGLLPAEQRRDEIKFIFFRRLPYNTRFGLLAVLLVGGLAAQLIFQNSAGFFLGLGFIACAMILTLVHGYSNVKPRTVPLLFNLRMDPFESFDNEDSYGHLLQKVSWLIGPMGELMQAHLKTLAEYPPVQGSKSFDMSNAVEEFVKKAKQ